MIGMIEMMSTRFLKVHTLFALLFGLFALFFLKDDDEGGGDDDDDDGDDDGELDDDDHDEDAGTLSSDGNATDDVENGNSKDFEHTFYDDDHNEQDQ